MENTVYTYTNKLGRRKELWVDKEPSKDHENKYCNVIWDLATGEFCGSGYNTKEEIDEMLAKMKDVEVREE